MNRPGRSARSARSFPFIPPRSPWPATNWRRPGSCAGSPIPPGRRVILARLTSDGDQMAERTSAALAEIGFGLGDVSTVTASQVTADLRKVREALGDFG